MSQAQTSSGWNFSPDSRLDRIRFADEPDPEDFEGSREYKHGWDAALRECEQEEPLWADDDAEPRNWADIQEAAKQAHRVGGASMEWAMGYEHCLTMLMRQGDYDTERKPPRSPAETLQRWRRKTDVWIEGGSPSAPRAQLAQQGAERSNVQPHKQVYRLAVDLLDGYLDEVLSGDLPQLIKQGDALDGIEVGEGLITLIGAPPGFGKTTFASQVMFDGCELNPDLIAYVCNAETDFKALIRRELTRITGVNQNAIRFGKLTTYEQDSVRGARSVLKQRLTNIRDYPDPSIASLLDLLGQPPGLVVVDYLQKFAPPDKDIRVGVGLVMGLLRKLARQGHAVLALSATKRDTKGRHDSQELNLASFKESGECEYQADSAYVLRDDGPQDEAKPYIRNVTLGHVKNRHGERIDRELVFHMPKMKFTKREPVVVEWSPDGTSPYHDEYEEGVF